jgi:hypothetical protein
MNAGRDVERLITDWLADEAPTGAPDRILAATGRTVDRTKQRRFAAAWRDPMSITALRLLAAAAVAIVIVVGGAALLKPAAQTGASGPTSPSPTTPASSAMSTAASPTVRPSESAGPGPSLIPVGALTQSHTSTLYAYTIKYPAAWNLTVGTNPGRVDYVSEDVAQGLLDFYSDTTGGSGHGLTVTSAPLSATRKDLGVFTAYVKDQVGSEFGTYLHLAACNQPTRALVVDGEPASEIDFICPDHNWIWVNTIHAGRAYQIAWLDDGGFDEGKLRPLLDKFLETFSFTG